MFHAPWKINLFFKIDAVWFTLMDNEIFKSTTGVKFPQASFSFPSWTQLPYFTFIYRSHYSLLLLLLYLYHYIKKLCHSYRNWQDRDWNPRDLHVSAYKPLIFNYCKSYLTLSLRISLGMHSLYIYTVNVHHHNRNACVIPLIL